MEVFFVINLHITKYKSCEEGNAQYNNTNMIGIA